MTLPAGWAVPVAGGSKRRRWPIHGMTVNERRTIGPLTPTELSKLKKTLQVYHSRHPGHRVAIQERHGRVNVWRLR